MSSAAQVASAQAIPTAERTLGITPFAMGSRVNTDYGTMNYGATVGFDVTRYYHRFAPSIEGRYTYSPSRDSGIVEQSFAGGLKLETPIGRIHPYFDLMYGFGTIKYIVSKQYSADDSSTLYEAGIGVDYAVTSRISIKAEGQVERWKLSGAANPLEPIIVSAGIAYTLPARKLLASMQRGLHSN